MNSKKDTLKTPLFHRYYKTLSLWLEEPRLQESGLYVPALPPQYMSQKLILILQGDEVMIFFFSQIFCDNLFLVFRILG